MNNQRFVLLVFATIMLMTLVSARAVNISNTWMLPEEGFPVFYRYFRDRISWYEADAVCQFHHANLVTADSSSQYDAIRAYLKELDISENVWIGLSKTMERPNFTWTDFRPLSGDGHWQQSIPKGNDPFCVAMDPGADFLWKPMACGGPDVASFICELPVPSWAMGPRGCLLTELPSLTVLYIPEQLALELTSDCGLDGTKRIACKGNADREEILKQLTCAISPDDFEDKSTKSSVSLNTVSSTLSEGTSEDNSLNSKTTKPWIWTSNTIDTDYGMPTRHRRETEDTISPASTKSTTDISVQESQFANKVTTETTDWNHDPNTTNFTLGIEKDVTTEANVMKKTKKAVGFKTVETIDVATQNINIQQEEQTEHVVTEESRASDSGDEDAGEFASAIGQGQLFSIIENGTMFDIIELNETTSEDLKSAKDIFMETPESEQEVLKASTVRSTIDHDDNFYTTVVYHKEPPLETAFVTNKSIKKSDKHAKKTILKEKIPPKHFQQNNLNSLENNKDDKKTLSKEVEMFPIMTDSLIKLNRTHRKELPFNEDENKKVSHKDNDLKVFGLDNTNDMNNEEHQHIEIKWHSGANANLTQINLFVTTKRKDIISNKAGNSSSKQNIEIIDDKDEVQKIDSRIDLLNNNNNMENNDSEIFIPSKPEKIQTEDSPSEKKQYLPKSLLSETNAKNLYSTSPAPSSDEPIEPIPQAQPRPNRQRQLTRPQRRSFYPYFFSRVLG